MEHIQENVHQKNWCVSSATSKYPCSFPETSCATSALHTSFDEQLENAKGPVKFVANTTEREPNDKLTK
jgi:hypothetical protein